MSQEFRLDKAGYINRDKKISFKFNKKKYFGYEGDTLASALLANGVHLVGRSFKYHRPRGFIGAGVDVATGKATNYQDSVHVKLIPLGSSTSSPVGNFKPQGVGNRVNTTQTLQSSKSKQDEGKKKLLRLYISGEITEEEYRQMMQELN